MPMLILLLTFVTLFLAIFSPCLVMLDRWEKRKNLAGVKVSAEREIAAANERAWRRNKQMILG